MAAVTPAYQALAANPAALVEAVNQNLMFGRMSTELRDLIVAATTAITDTSAGGLRERARGALYLAAISSENLVYSDTSVAGASAVQPPTGLAVSGLAGTTVTLSWRAPLIGPAPTGYVLEGGVRPGEVLATIPIDSTAADVHVPGAAWRVLHPPAHGVRRRRQPSVERDSALRRNAGRTDRAQFAVGLRQELVAGPQVAQHVWRRRADWASWWTSARTARA